MTPSVGIPAFNTVKSFQTAQPKHSNHYRIEVKPPASHIYADHCSFEANKLDVHIKCGFPGFSFQVWPISAFTLFCRQHSVRIDEARWLQETGTTCVPAACVDCGQWKSCPQQHKHTLSACVRLRLWRCSLVLWSCGLYCDRPEHRCPPGYFRLHHHTSG